MYLNRTKFNVSPHIPILKIQSLRNFVAATPLHVMHMYLRYLFCLTADQNNHLLFFRCHQAVLLHIMSLGRKRKFFIPGICVYFLLVVSN